MIARLASLAPEALVALTLVVILFEARVVGHVRGGGSVATQGPRTCVAAAVVLACAATLALGLAPRSTIEATVVVGRFTLVNDEATSWLRAALAAVAALGLIGGDDRGATRLCDGRAPPVAVGRGVAAVLGLVAATLVAVRAADLAMALAAVAAAWVARVVAVASSLTRGAAAAAAHAAVRDTISLVAVAWGATILVATTGAMNLATLGARIDGASRGAGELPMAPYVGVVLFALGLLSPAVGVARDVAAAPAFARPALAVLPLAAALGPLAHLAHALVPGEPLPSRIRTAVPGVVGPWTVAFAVLALVLAIRQALAALTSPPPAAAVRLVTSSLLLALLPLPARASSGESGALALLAATAGAAAVMLAAAPRAFAPAGAAGRSAYALSFTLAAATLAGLPPGGVFVARLRGLAAILDHRGAFGEGRILLILAIVVVGALQLVVALRLSLAARAPAPHDALDSLGAASGRPRSGGRAGALALLVLAALLLAWPALATAAHVGVESDTHVPT